MKLTDLLDHLDGATLHGSGEAEIHAAACDSRQAGPGMIFAALPGASADGEAFAVDAAARGAAALLAGRRLDGIDLPQIVSETPRRAFAQICEALHDHPGRRLTLVGVTGTNGKTTTAYLVREILRAAGRTCGMLGTIGYDNGETVRPAPLTTPDAAQFSGLLAEMAANGCDAAAVEVSSHALEQDRTAGAVFAAGIFTNLSRDHLDYHHDMEAYGRAKMRLFESLPASAPAVLNADDPWSDRMAAATRARVRTYGLAPDREADLSGRVRAMGIDGTDLELCDGRWRTMVHTPLVGLHNIANALAASLAALELGADLSAVVQGLSSFAGAPGRLERFDAPSGYHVFVDYAHTEDALRRVLTVLRPLCDGRLVVVFGCGGDRDRGKRPGMAEAAEALADRVVVTSDNPRMEDPRRIEADIRAGFRRPDDVVWEPNRAAAIRAAVRDARRGDVVLVAGKGHEDYQILGRKRITLDDRALVRAAVGA